MENGGAVKLTADISGVTETLNISKDTTLDLNGHTLTTSATTGILVKDNIAFTLENSNTTEYEADGKTLKGKIVNTADQDEDTVSNIKNHRDTGGYAAIKVGETGVGSTADTTGSNASFIMNGGIIESYNTSILVLSKSSVEITKATCSVSSSKSSAVYIANKYGDSTTNRVGGNLTITAGTLTSTGDFPTIQVGKNLRSGTTIEISGGNVIYNHVDEEGNPTDVDTRDGSAVAIYSGGVTDLTISGNANITSTHIGIEFSAGDLDITGGTISASGTNPILYGKTDRGTTFRDGVAVVVSQYLGRPIDVDISGGNISGYAAFAVANANGVGAFDENTTGNSTDGGTIGADGINGDGKVAEVTVDITGGTLTSNAPVDTESEATFIPSTDENALTNKNSAKVDTYKLAGKNAIVNLDSRVTVNLSGTAVVGSAAAMTKGRTSDSDTGYNMGAGNTFSGFTSSEGGTEGFLTYGTIGDNENFKVSKLGLGGTFNRPDKDITEWKYLTNTGDTVAALTQDPEDENTLKLSVTGEPVLTKPAEIDLTDSALFSGTGEITKLDASAAPVVFSLNIKGNDKITQIIGGAGNDSIKPGDVPTVTLEGGDGADLFFFDGNSNTITDFGTGDDSVTLANSKFRPANADFLATKENDKGKGKITIDFGGGDALMFENLDDETEVSLTGGHVFATRYHAFDKQIALTSVQSAAFFDASEAKFANYATIDAASASAISIMGNSLDNRIIGSNQGGTLNGGDKNDRLIVTDRNSSAKYQFEHKAGKDSIEGFDDTNDTLAVNAADITEAKGSGSKLTLTFGKDNDNSVVLKSDVDIEKVSLNASGDYLTSSGYRTTNGETKEFKLFANAKGKIDLTDTPYKGTGITAIDASAAEKQSVTLTADSNVTTVKLAENNKKKDLFVYGGGAVSISGYEAGTDKLNIADVGAVSLFTVDSTGVSINAGGKGIISIQGALTNQEVLIRDGGKSNSYQKFVFAKTGVLYNKAKKPTEATIYQNVDNKEAFKAEDSVKKIFLQAGVSGASIQSGNNKATLDASEANGVSLIGGAKNNKFIGSAGDDLFVYKGGKDNIQGFDAKDKITLDGDFSLSSAKISASSKSLKFKFTNKNVLTLKSDGKITSASINGGNYSFSKNAVGLNGVVSLTNAFSGSYNLAKSTAIGNTVDGSAVKKNLTFKGTDAAESLSGGQKKTTFKGGGGADIFVGNSTGKDVFFYAKTDSGNKTIKDFGFGSNNDKIKIASGTIKTISKSGNDIIFSTNGGSLTVTKDADKEVLIKANNTCYWFDEKDNLITADTKVSNAQAVATGYDVIDLGYSTNLVKTNLATKAGSFTFSQGSITKNNTTT